MTVLMTSKPKAGLKKDQSSDEDSTGSDDPKSTQDHGDANPVGKPAAVIDNPAPRGLMVKQLSKTEEVTVGTYANDEMFKKLKFINNTHLRNHPEIISDCLDRLGLKEKNDRLRYTMAVERRFKKCLNNRRHYIITKLKSVFERKCPMLCCV